MSDLLSKNISQAGYWEWSLDNESFFHNPILRESLGYTEQELPDNWNNWKRFIFPSDKEAINISLKKYIKEKIDKPFVQEARLIHKNGSILHIMFIARITQFGDDGLPIKMEGSHVDITQQKESEYELVRVKNLLNKTNQAALIGGWELDIKTDHLTWTSVTKSIFGVPEDHIPVRGTTFDFFKNKKDKGKLFKALNDAISTGKPYDLEARLTTTAGKEIWVRCMGQAEFAQGKCVRIFGVIQDINQKKLNEENLRLKQKQLTTFIDHSPVAIAMMDKDMNYIAASNVWKSFFNLENENIQGKNYYKVFPDTNKTWKRNHQRGLSGEVLKMDEDRLVLQDGTIEWLQWEIRPWFITPGEIGGIIIYCAIISEKYAYKESLIKAKEQAEHSSSMKSKFLSVMSHEMRTPLNAVIGFINLLLQDPRPDQLDYMNVLKFSAENLLVIINDILDFSKLDADKVQLEVTEFDLKKLLQNIKASLQQEADLKHLELELSIHGLIPESLKGDSVHLNQVITNLVTNAIKFTSSGKVSLIAKVKDQDKKSVTIGFEIQDTGIGIPFDKQDQIFEMFSQASSDTTRKFGGTGLGLTISKRLLELMGSQIRLKSESGRGATFSFDITFKIGRKKSADQGAKTFINQDHQLLEGARILIVEDNLINVMLAQKFLSQWKCICSKAENGSIALEMVKNEDFDLVLMDLQMPVMDGYEAAFKIRNLEKKKYKNLPIIALTASALTDMKTNIFKSGINDFINKPFNPEELYHMIAKYLKK